MCIRDSFDAKPLARWSTWNGDSVASVGSGGMTDDHKAKASPVPSSRLRRGLLRNLAEALTREGGPGSRFRVPTWYRAQDHAGRFTDRSPIQPNAGPVRRGRPGDDAGGPAVHRSRLRHGSTLPWFAGAGGGFGYWDDDQPIARGRRRRRRDRT